MPVPVALRFARGGSLLALAVLAAAPAVARAEARAGEIPVLAGPVALGPADLQVGPAELAVVFGEGARMAHVEITLPVSSATGGELVFGFGGRGAWQLEADLDGTAASVARATGLPLGAGPWEAEFTVAAVLTPGLPATLRVRALGDTAGAPREPELTYPQAAFVLNRLLDEPQARSIRLMPGPLVAAGPAPHMRVETLPPQRPEAPVAGDVVSSGGRAVLEGPVVADLAAPLDIAAVEGDYAAPRTWGVVFGFGGAVDWPREWGRVGCAAVAADGTCDTPQNGWQTRDAADPASRVWFRGGVDVVLDPHWMIEAGAEGDFAGALELPVQFLWYPQDGRPGLFDLFGDYHFLFGAALQLIDNRMPEDFGFDPRLFLRVGAGIRFLLVTLEAVYEIAPPLGAWHDRWGGLEHKLLITLPFRF